MRPIKFRAWHKDLKIMKSVFNINFDHNEVIVGKENDRTTWFQGTFELMQFTGLHSKNGEEICEEDILLIKHQKLTIRGIDHGKVFYQSSKARFYLKCLDSNAAFGMFNKLSQINKFSEIVGNIHQNPELLENK
jgi:uncharacterized phage protein (TIGR01671 family)